MHTHKNKARENKSQSAASSVSGQGRVIDHHQEAVAQRQWHDVANNSPRARQTAQLQTIADGFLSRQSSLIQKKENNTGLPDDLKSGVENLSGYAMDDVRVHFDSDKPAQLNAHAYAQGANIYLAPGQKNHLPHEAWHVVQQKQGRVKPTMQLKGKIPVNDDQGLEKEADVMGQKALRATKTAQQDSALTRNGLGEAPRLNQAGPRQPVAQGKFGFEIETKLLLTAGKADANTADPAAFGGPDRYLPAFPVAAVGRGFKVHVDHTGSFKSVVEGGPIAELVTDPPINEATQSEDDAARIAQNMADAATSMGAAPTIPSKLSSKSKINSVNSSAGTEIYVGYPGASGQSTYGYVQATFGVKLAAVPQMLTHMAKPEMATSSKTAKVFTAAVAEASAVTARLRAKFTEAMGSDDYVLSNAWTKHHSAKHGRDFHYHKESGTSQWDEPTNAQQVAADFKQLEGYLALVLQYLIAGRDYQRGEVPTNLLKNAIGQLFYKTKLSTLAGTMQGWAKTVLKEPDWRALVKSEVLSECGRSADEEMSRAMTAAEKHKPAKDRVHTVKVGDWLDSIFSGTDDDIFTDSINPWSSELVDQVGPTGHKAPSAVVENRRVNPLGGPRTYGSGVSPQQIKGWMKPDEWPALARYYHQMVTALNNTDPKAPPDSVAPSK